MTDGPGHPIPLIRKLAAEFFGTFCLVLVGTGAIIVNDVSGGGVTPVGIALCFGFVVLAMILAVGDVSGSHINPAVTCGLCVAGLFPAGQVIPYVVSQCAGAIAASSLLRLLFPQHATLGGTLPAGSETQAFCFEVLLTAILMFTILNVVSTRPAVRLITIATAVGAVIALSALWAGPVCGASLNPARSLAPALLTGSYTSLWLYLVAPVCGALAGVVAWRAVRV
jgi:MIP family channel proteins